MNTHFDSVLRVAVIFGAALAAMPLLRSRSAVARRLVLSLAFAAAMLVTILPARLIPTTLVEAPALPQLVANVVQEPAVASPTAAMTAADHGHHEMGSWLLVAWAAGALIAGMRFAFGYVRAARLVRRSRPGGERDVRVAHGIDSPAVAGILSPVILVPESFDEWTTERKRAVLLHERSHVRANDGRVQLLAAVVCTMHWFNPLAWLAARRLRLERELAADEAVLRDGLRATTYAEDLLAIAAAAPAGMIAMGEKPLARRITAIVAPQPAPLGRPGAMALAAGAGALTFAVACTSTSTSTSAASAPREKEPAPAPASASGATSATSANSPLQPLIATELERAVSTWKAAGGAILVVTPKGEVVAEAGDTNRPIVAGSTMKPLLLATAFDENAVTESDADVGELLAKSDNPGFARIFERVGDAKLGKRLRGFHFALPTKLDAEAAIGGTMTATPRQVALAYAALANGGEGIVSTESAARVSKLMEGVVTAEHGTGKKARVAGHRVAGKTGTSEWKDEARGPAKHTYASFVGYLPADAPKYVIYVGIESAKGNNPWGGEVAAPVFARIAAESLR